MSGSSYRQVTLKKVKALTNELVKADKVHQESYPQPKNKDLPRNFFLAGFAGSRGSGKTALAIRLLKDYEESGMFDEKGNRVPQIIKLISPTSESNPAFKQLKHLADEDVHQSYSDKLLLNLVEEVKKDRLLTRKYKQACYLEKVFNKHIRRGVDPMLAMEKKDLHLLSAETNGFRDHPKVPPHPYGVVVHLILDDCVSSPAFRLARDNVFSGFCLNSRHYWSNILLLSQRAKQIPPIIRSNITLLAIWRTMSSRLLLEEVWPLVSGILTEQDFITYYEAATQASKWDCLVIDTMAEEGKQIKRNLDQIMSLKQSA